MGERLALIAAALALAACGPSASTEADAIAAAVEERDRQIAEQAERIAQLEAALWRERTDSASKRSAAEFQRISDRADADAARLQAQRLSDELEFERERERIRQFQRVSRGESAFEPL